METKLAYEKKELIILIKSIFNMETKNNLRTSKKTATQNKITKKEPKRNFILAS